MSLERATVANFACEQRNVCGGEGPEMKHLATAGARYVTAGTGRERKAVA
jgi:hypothetical protein